MARFVHSAWSIGLLAAASACSNSSTSSAVASVGPSGGVVRAAGVEINVPAGALAESIAISVTVAETQAVPTGDQLDGRVYTFAPAGLHFASPITVTFPTGKSGESVFWTEPGSSDHFDALPTVIANGSAVAHPSHFSSAFVGKVVAASHDGGPAGDAGCVTEPLGCVQVIPGRTPSHYYVDLSSCDVPGNNVQGDPFCVRASGLGLSNPGWCCCGADGEGCSPPSDSGTMPPHDAAGVIDAAHGEDGAPPPTDGGVLDASIAADATLHADSGVGGDTGTVDGDACVTYGLQCVPLMQHPASTYYVDLSTCDHPGTDMGQPYCRPLSSFNIQDAGHGIGSAGYCCCGPDGEGC